VSAISAATNWLLMVVATAAAIAHQALRPMNWRRTARAEFWRFLDLVGIGNLTAVGVTAALIGIAVVAQGLYWQEQFGRQEAVIQVMTYVVIREVGPLIVALLTLGTGGMLLLGELATLRSGGQLDTLDRQGVDPFLVLVVPRVAALVTSIFAHSLIFIVIAFVTGYAMARAVGGTPILPSQFVVGLLSAIGTNGYLILPAKSVAFGLTIGAICGWTAIDRRSAETPNERLTATGFIRGLSGILLVGALLSVTL
jgi:phospholipid/cholesterol/gamma-HCH transport system permease protein